MSNETEDRKPNVLEEANEIIHGDRNKDYGHPYDNHSTTATMWAAYLSRINGRPVKVSAQDVCILNILQKTSRGANMMTRDTQVDIAGYAGNIEMIHDEQIRRNNTLEA